MAEQITDPDVGRAVDEHERPGPLASLGDEQRA